MLAGEFSSNARARLTNELSPKIEIFDLTWLTDKFTEFYPQIFFHGQVIDFLQKKSSELEDNHRRGKSDKHLSEYFVNPLIRPLSALMDFDEENLKAVFEKRKRPFLELLEISKKRKKLILAGDPGTGKTGAMAKLAIDRYQRAYEDLLKKPGGSDKRIPVPILLHAREFLKSESVEVLLTTYFESKETQSRFKVDLLVVDGLDEIEPEKRPNLIDKLDEFSEEIGCSYILTTRKIDLIRTLPEQYEKYELLPFEIQSSLTTCIKISKR